MSKNVIFGQTEKRYNHGSKQNHEWSDYGKQMVVLLEYKLYLTLWFGGINIGIEVEEKLTYIVAVKFMDPFFAKETFYYF